MDPIEAERDAVLKGAPLIDRPHSNRRPAEESRPLLQNINKLPQIGVNGF